MADIFINFRTTYVDAYSGEEVTDGSKIAKNYMFGRFLIDLVSMIPFELLTKRLKQHTNLRELELRHYAIISCLKLVRVLRLE